VSRPRARAAFLAGLLAALCAACLDAGLVPPGPTPARTPLAPATATGLPRHRSMAARGRAAYQALCGTCHGPDGGGDGPAAAALRPRPTNFRDAGYMAGQRPTWYDQAIREGVVGSAMRPWGHRLDEDTRWDTVYYLMSLTVPPAQLEAGERIYAERCAACHGERGDTLAAARLDDPALAALSRKEVAALAAARHPDRVGPPDGPAAAELAAWLGTFLYEPLAEAGR
jgi:mono/diheme cytochrome c family protein